MLKKILILSTILIILMFTVMVFIYSQNKNVENFINSYIRYVKSHPITDISIKEYFYDDESYYNAVKNRSINFLDFACSSFDSSSSISVENISVFPKGGKEKLATIQVSCPSQVKKQVNVTFKMIKGKFLIYKIR